MLLAGGGSGGSATPVLAVAQALRRLEPSIELLYVGTRDGPEATLAAAQGIPFQGVHAGKLRRYWDARNLSDPLRVVQGVGESYALVRAFQPTAAMAAGGFGAVPPMVAARAFGARTLIHQQDVEPGLANRLLVPFARQITVSLNSSLAHFPRKRTSVTGNPVRAEILAADSAAAFTRLKLEPDVPLVVATGGGTGALSLNRLVAAAAPRLIARAQIVHLTGRGRGSAVGDPFAALSGHRISGRRDAGPAGGRHAGHQSRRYGNAQRAGRALEAGARDPDARIAPVGQCPGLRPTRGDRGR